MGVGPSTFVQWGTTGWGVENARARRRSHDDAFLPLRRFERQLVLDLALALLLHPAGPAAVDYEPVRLRAGREQARAAGAQVQAQLVPLVRIERVVQHDPPLRLDLVRLDLRGLPVAVLVLRQVRDLDGGGGERRQAQSASV